MLTSSNGTKARRAQVDELNAQKVNRIINVLGKRQELGIKVTIVTCHPDAYKYGRDAVRMELMKKMRKAGFEVRLVEEGCEHLR